MTQILMMNTDFYLLNRIGECLKDFKDLKVLKANSDDDMTPTTTTVNNRQNNRQPLGSRLFSRKGAKILRKGRKDLPAMQFPDCFASLAMTATREICNPKSRSDDTLLTVGFSLRTERNLTPCPSPKERGVACPSTSVLVGAAHLSLRRGGGGEVFNATTTVQQPSTIATQTNNFQFSIFNFQLKKLHATSLHPAGTIILNLDFLMIFKISRIYLVNLMKIMVQTIFTSSATAQLPAAQANLYSRLPHNLGYLGYLGYLNYLDNSLKY